MKYERETSWVWHRIVTNAEIKSCIYLGSGRKKKFQLPSGRTFRAKETSYANILMQMSCIKMFAKEHDKISNTEDQYGCIIKEHGELRK